MYKKYGVLTLVIVSLVLAGYYVKTNYPITKKAEYTEAKKKDGARATATGKKEYINPSGPALPINNNSDWFKAVENTSFSNINKNISLSAALERANYSMLLRPQATDLMPAKTVMVQPEIISTDGRTVADGFSIRYGDRIELRVMPSALPINANAMISQTGATNTAGEVQIYYQTSVRGAIAVGREAGIQKWEDGTENAYPAYLAWSEPGAGNVPYVKYLLIGDGPVSKLKGIAESLIRVNKQ